MARKDDAAAAGLEAYRRVMVDASVAQAVQELAVLVGELQRCAQTREEETARLLERERAAEEAAWAAYEAAKQVGAKVSHLESAGLKPSRSAAVDRPRRTRKDTPSEAAARVPLTPPAEPGRTVGVGDPSPDVDVL